MEKEQGKRDRAGKVNGPEKGTVGWRERQTGEEMYSRLVREVKL